MAGLSIAGLMLPEAVAYAGIAGLPPQRAILAAIAGSLAYLVAGRSRFAIISPTSSSAAILAAALAAFPGTDGTRAAMATLLVAMVGVIFIVAAVARLGGLASFVSRPVLRGFAFGLAITIIIKQLPVLTGLPVKASNVGALLATTLAHAGAWHGTSVLTGVAALAALLALRRMPSLPGAFIVLLAGIGASALLDLPSHGVAVVGTMSLVPHWEGLALPGWRETSRLVQLAVPLVLILFAESWGTMRGLALRHGETAEPDREMGALGLANLVAAGVQGMPVGAGFSAGSAAEAAGAGSRWTGLFAAMGLAALVLLAMPWVARLPEPVLAAVVVAALVHALDPAPLLRLWRIRRDVVTGVGAALGVLVLGVLNGMLFAILLSLAVLIRRLATPHFTRLGQLGEGHDYVDMARHPDAVSPPGLLIIRPAEPLFFANAERVLTRIADYQSRDLSIRRIVLSLEESFDLDSSALDALVEFAATMHARGILLRLARVRDSISDLLRQSGATDLADQSSHSVDDAVMALSKETQ